MSCSKHDQESFNALIDEIVSKLLEIDDAGYNYTNNTVLEIIALLGDLRATSTS